MSSVWEAFHFAILELVRSTPIKQRLVCAYGRHLSALSEDHLPAEVREPFTHVRRSMCGVQPLRGEDAVAASVRKMSGQEADDCAASIVEIFGRLSRPQSPAAARGATVVQLHAVERGEPYDVPALIASH